MAVPHEIVTVELNTLFVSSPPDIYPSYLYRKNRRRMKLWKRKERECGAVYERLVDGGCRQCRDDRLAPRGYVPVLVGTSGGDGQMERFQVHVKMLSKPCIVALLDMASREFGYRQDGILRIPCDVDRFRQLLSEACKSR